MPKRDDPPPPRSWTVAGPSVIELTIMYIWEWDINLDNW